MNIIEEAVQCALNPNADPQLKVQAMNYCDQIRTSIDGWLICLSLFTHQPKR
jgi:exportin-T